MGHVLAKGMGKPFYIFFLVVGAVIYIYNYYPTITAYDPSLPKCDDDGVCDFDLQTNLADVSETEMEYNFDYDKLIQNLNLKTKPTFPFFGFPFIASLYRQRHIFRSISDFVYSSKFNDLIPENVKCGDILFVRTDFIKDFIENYHPKINYPYVLLTHESDLGVGHLPWHLNYLNDTKVIKWFAQNTLGSHPKLIPLPLGIVPPFGNVFATLYDLARNVKPYYNKTQLLFLNFSPNTNKDRIKTLKYFQKNYGNHSSVKINEGLKTSWIEYLENLQNSQFVLSPPGNGIDCIRTWESLIFGAVPIVKQSYLQPLYDNLPVMVVKEWSEVTEESMKKFQQEKLTKFSKDGLPWRPSIWLRYWIKEIIETKLNYVKNYC